MAADEHHPEIDETSTFEGDVSSWLTSSVFKRVLLEGRRARVVEELPRPAVPIYQAEGVRQSTERMYRVALDALRIPNIRVRAVVMEDPPQLIMEFAPETPRA